MGYCDPKAIRNGKAWADVVNTPGFMGVKAPSELKSIVIGRISSPSLAAEAARATARALSGSVAPPTSQRHTEITAMNRIGKMFTSVWIATPESTCASQVMFHPEGALSPRNSFATVTFFKPEQNCPPHVSTDDACIYDHAYLVHVAKQAVEQYAG